MVISTGNFIFLILSTLISLTMILEGILLLTAQKLTTPIPSRILLTMGNVVLGRERSSQTFSGKHTLQTQRTYALFALGFGIMILVACALNLTFLLNS